MALQNRFSYKNVLFQGISTFIFYKILKFWPISYQLGLQQIPKDFFIRSCDIYNENRWTDNYSAIRTYNGGYEYINISIKSTELENFIKEHKLLFNL